MKARSVAAAVVVFTALSAACTTMSPTRRGMSLKEATAIVDAFEATPRTTHDVLEAPKTLEQATALLKRDRLDGFSLITTWLEARRAVVDREPAQILDDTALSAQVLLAWGEAELLMGEVLSHAANVVEQQVEAELLKNPKADVAARRVEIAHWRRTDEALRLLAAEHVDAGAREADAVVALAADSYLGYRIGADAARLTNNWVRFESLVEQVETARPDSNGLRFLRGVQAWSQQQDADVAAFELQAAIDADPDFIRARAWLVVVTTGEARRAAFEALAAASPDHQLVRAGAGIRSTSSAVAAQPN